MKFSLLLKRLWFKNNQVKIAKSLGVKIGTGCRILSRADLIFSSEPWLITIGNNVEITFGVRMLTHDGGIWVVRNLENKKNLDYFAPITIGNNVFIGNNVIILPGVTVGDNVVIGAGSVVTKDITGNSVIAGVPAKVITTYEDYKNRMIKKSTPTKGMNLYEKKEYLKKSKPEWFQ